MEGSRDPYGENMPSYFQLLTDVKWGAEQNLREWAPNTLSSWPSEFIHSLVKYGHLTWIDICLIVALAVLWTILRYTATRLCLIPLGQWLQLTPHNMNVKFPESTWKCFFYSMTWSYECYVVLWSGHTDFFQKPLTIWTDWMPSVPVPAEIYWLYMIQLSFYVHCIYACLYMDHWRKDTLVMLFHHLLTLALVGVSYATRFHKIGVLVLFCHDINDICLEFTKSNVYLKDRGHKYHALNDHMATAGFFSFAVTWFVFRLYWYPLKVLHTTGYGSMLYSPQPKMPFYFFFNILLWILQLLNVYWFMFIVKFLYKVATGQMDTVEDLRENEVADKYSNIGTKDGSKAAGDHVNNGTSIRRSKRLAKQD